MKKYILGIVFYLIYFIILYLLITDIDNITDKIGVSSVFTLFYLMIGCIWIAFNSDNFVDFHKNFFNTLIKAFKTFLSIK